MYARVFSYTVQPGKLNERNRYGLDILSQTRQRLGFRGLLILGNEKTSRSVAVQIWDTEEDMRASGHDPEYERILPHHPDQGFVEGPVTVEDFEVMAYEPMTAQARAAWMVGYQAQPEVIEERVKHAQEIVAPVLRTLPGYHGRLLLADRARNALMAFSLWQNMAELEQAAASSAYQQSLVRGGLPPADMQVEHLDVVHLE
jgi:hypothetical protein